MHISKGLKEYGIIKLSVTKIGNNIQTINERDNKINKRINRNLLDKKFLILIPPIIYF